MDIGCNTGYFVIESCLQGSSSVDAFEPHPELARISEICCEAAGLSDRVIVHRGVFDFSRNDLGQFDICLLQNVLHHIGDDFFQESQLGQGETLNLIADILVGMYNVADQVILQLGFNWKGDTTKPLFADGTKEEMIQFVHEAVDGIFDIEAIGIAEMSTGGITYQKPNAKNIDRDDLLGEFLNRPIFILRKPRVE